MLVCVSEPTETPARAELIARLKEVRAQAIEHARIAQELARERRRIMERLLAEGLSQADLARELGVTRQAIQKMMAVGRKNSRA
jgi:DNA-binding XRE family transcriptional regulator